MELHPSGAPTVRRRSMLEGTLKGLMGVMDVGEMARAFETQGETRCSDKSVWLAQRIGGQRV